MLELNRLQDKVQRIKFKRNMTGVIIYIEQHLYARIKIKYVNKNKKITIIRIGLIHQ